MCCRLIHSDFVLFYINIRLRLAFLRPWLYLVITPLTISQKQYAIRLYPTPPAAPQRSRRERQREAGERSAARGDDLSSTSTIPLNFTTASQGRTTSQALTTGHHSCTTAGSRTSLARHSPWLPRTVLRLLRLPAVSRLLRAGFTLRLLRARESPRAAALLAPAQSHGWRWAGR